MENFYGQPKFEIQSTIEQKPFESSAVQSFFKKWCEINDSIVPEIVTRDEWEKKRESGYLEKRQDGKQSLFIPTDLQLWEMVGVMEAVDHDTFSVRPEKQDEKKDELLKLGKTFRDVGAYIALRIDSIKEGKEIARDLAEELYKYGESIVSGEKPEKDMFVEEMSWNELSPEDTVAVDRFLAGDTLYATRQARAEKATELEPEKKDELHETERQRTLTQFFRVAEKAFILQQKTKDGELSNFSQESKPWQSNTPIHSAFLRKVEQVIEQKIETPKTELGNAIFRRGLEKLVNEMKVEGGFLNRYNMFLQENGIDSRVEEMKLVDALRLPDLKAELETTRETLDSVVIANKEREIANRIQAMVSSYQYESSANNPSEMVARQYVNCVGASMLAGALFSEVGMKYLVAGVPEHSVLIFVASDGKIEWRDMLGNDHESKEEITDEMINGKTKEGMPLTSKDIVAFVNNPNSESLEFDIKKKVYRNILEQVQPIALFSPEIGHQIQVLGNTGLALESLGRHEEAVEAYRQAVSLYPERANFYHGLGNSLKSLGRHEEAVEAYRQAIKLGPKDAVRYFESGDVHNPDNSTGYYGLGTTLSSIGRHEEAIEAFRQAIKLNPENVNYYFALGNALGGFSHNKESLEAYRRGTEVEAFGPDDEFVFYKLGAMLSIPGYEKESTEAYRKFILSANKSGREYNPVVWEYARKGSKEA